MERNKSLQDGPAKRACIGFHNPACSLLVAQLENQQAVFPEPFFLMARTWPATASSQPKIDLTPASLHALKNSTAP